MQRFRGFFLRYLWVLALAALGLVTLCTAPRAARESTEENRMLAGFPACSAETVFDGSFATGVESWLSDGIAGRTFMVNTAANAEALFAIPQDADTLAKQAMEALEAEAATATPDGAVYETAAPSETPAIDDGAETDAAGAIQETTFWIARTDGSVDHVYTFSVANVQNAIHIFNSFRALLPEDGHVIFSEVPIAQTGIGYQTHRETNVAWGSDVEAQLQAHADDGVLIVNGCDVLLEHLEQNEYVYFRTDHHWTPLGAYYVYAAMMQAQNVSPMAYEDYDYTVHSSFIGSAGNTQSADSLRAKADTLEVIAPISPVHSYLLTRLVNRQEIDYMFPARNSYTAYLGGTRGPWRLFETGFQTGRTALLIGDSFSNALLPFLLPHYDRVLMVDLRPTYYDATEAGAGIKQYIEAYGVDDVYIMVCFATSINSNFFTNGTIVAHMDEEAAG